MKTPEKAGHTGQKQPPLHNAHVFAWYRHHPLDPDESLFIAIDNGSIAAQVEMVDLFLSYVRQQVLLPPAVQAYIVQHVQAQSARHEADYQLWQRSQDGRTSAAGRHSAKARGQETVQALGALLAALQSGCIVPDDHPGALKALVHANETQRRKILTAKARGAALPRAYRGSHSRRAQAFCNAMDVTAVLKTHPHMSVGEAIRQVAQARIVRSEMPAGPLQSAASRQVADQQMRVIEGLARTIERHYYEIEKSRSAQGLAPLEVMLDN